MAYGVVRFTIHRGEQQADLTTVQGRGLYSQPAAWKGMGPSGSTRPPSLAVSPCLGYLLLFVCAAFISADGMQASKREGCQIEHCSDSYEIAKQELDIKGPGPHDSRAMCMAIRTYKECMYLLLNSCNGDLMFYTARNFIQKTMNENKCDEVGPVLTSPATKGPGPVPVLCDYHSKGSSKLCVLFGDPHLRTFDQEFQTCKVKGAWPLVNNDYLTVQVTNNPVEGALDATATSKLTVIVKGNPECTSKNFQTYQAHTNYLPGTFEDGGVIIGQYRSLELVEVDPGRHVEIHIRYIKTVVVIRQIGRYFTFSISMPEELVNQSSRQEDLQLCVRGCPQSELINYQEFLAKRRHSSSPASKPAVHTDSAVQQQVTLMTRSQAEHICKSAKLVDFYFDSCVFDLLTTGDQNFTLSAIHALQDVVKLQSSLVKYMANRTSLDNYDQIYGSNSGPSNRLPHPGLILLLAVMTILLCSR